MRVIGSVRAIFDGLGEEGEIGFERAILSWPLYRIVQIVHDYAVGGGIGFVPRF